VGVSWLGKRRAPERHHGVTNVLVERAAMPEDDLRHLGEVAVQQVGHFLRVERFGECRETSNIAEEHGDRSLLRFYAIRLFEQPGNDFRADVLAERSADLSLFSFFEENPVQRYKAGVRENGYR